MGHFFDTLTLWVIFMLFHLTKGLIMRKLSKTKRIEQTVWHEVGHVIMSMHHGIVPLMVIVCHNGWHGDTQFSKMDGEKIDKRHKDVLLAGYAWVRLFAGMEQDGFFSKGDSMGVGETDWCRLGCPTRERIEKMIERYYANLNLEGVSWVVHNLLNQYGFLPHKALNDIYNSFF